MHERILDAIERDMEQFEQYVAEYRDQEIAKVEVQHRAGKITKVQRDEMVKDLRLAKIAQVNDYYRQLNNEHAPTEW